MKQLRVWWIPQIPGKAFHVTVRSPQRGLEVMDMLANYDLFQFENNIKPDYSNMGGLEELLPEDGEWHEWEDEFSGENIEDLRQEKREAEVQL